MAASLLERTTSQFGIVVSVLTFFVINSGVHCNSSAPPTSSGDSYHFQSLFSDFLTELHGYETNIHRCMVRANRTQCFNSLTKSQTFFTFPSMSVALELNCLSKDIYSCMSSDSFVSGILDLVEVDISKTVEDVCCFLAECQKLCAIEDDHHATPSPNSTKMQVAIKGDCHQDCINCTKFLGTDDKKYFERVNILQNMTCTNKTFNNFPCTELNIVALNVLSTTSSSKLLKDAKDMIKHCNPGFFEDPGRTFSAMINTPTNDEISSLVVFFSSDSEDADPIQSQPKIKKRPGKVIGIVFLVITVIASLFVMGWLVRTRIFNGRSMTANFSNVLYSRIDYQDENLDDYSDDDEDKGELSMFERA